MDLSQFPSMMSLEGKLIVALISAVVHHAVYLGSGPLSKALFKGLRYDYGEQRTWRSRCTSLVHSLIVGSLGFYVLFIEKKVHMEKIWDVSTMSMLTMAISAGYFLWDSIVVLYRYELYGFLFALHGVYCLYVYGAAILYPVYHYHAMALLMFEWSTPAMNLFFMFDHIESKMDTNAAIANGKNGASNSNTASKSQSQSGAPKSLKLATFLLSLVFALSFFLVRIVWGCYHYYHYYRVQINHWSETPIAFNLSLMILILVAFFLNGNWMVQIILTGLNILPKPDANTRPKAHESIDEMLPKHPVGAVTNNSNGTHQHRAKQD